MKVLVSCLALFQLGVVTSAFRTGNAGVALHRQSAAAANVAANINHAADLQTHCLASQLSINQQKSRSTSLQMSDGYTDPSGDNRPQVFATGYSTNPSLERAIEEATNSALSSLPQATTLQYEIDLAMVVASSLYEEPSKIVPTLVKVVESSSGIYGYGRVKHLVGGTAGGVIGSRTPNRARTKSDGPVDEQDGAARECAPFEAEATPAISVTLALLPNVELQTFHLNGKDVPEFDGDFTRSENAAKAWKETVGLTGFGEASEDEAAEDGEAKEKDEDAPVFMVIPSPAFQNDLDDFLGGLQYAYPTAQTFGGIASTVSSLSRARIFAYSADKSVAANSVYGDGCVGLAMKGDLRVDTMIAQGAKPVGGVYRVVAAGQKQGGGSVTAEEDDFLRSTIGAIVLDEAATMEEEEDYDKEEEPLPEDEKEAKRAKLMAEYAKARIPKPPLAEANFIMKKL